MKKLLTAFTLVLLMAGAATAQQNDAEIQQIGGDTNVAMIGQSGMLNTAFISQEADNDEASIQQSGDNNIATVLQGFHVDANGYDTDAEIIQIGNRNEATITQTGRHEVSGFIHQTGDDNIAFIEQDKTDDFNNARVQIIQTGGEENFVLQQQEDRRGVFGEVLQDGSENYVHQTQTIGGGGSGQFSHVLSKQLGDFNTADVDQNGERGSGETHQHGDDNDAFITQDGDENSGHILQEGMLNMATINQMGNLHNANIHQNGESNTASITQN
ncbi:hypothetical protein [Rhodohalobacter sp. 8-1]|uniref:hypothetical protein n=1 Tax=Rhodohalobacter sp. 8-1 TaxID=3131972 RepID=UPI0030ED387D